MWLSKIYYLYQILPAILFVFTFLWSPVKQAPVHDSDNTSLKAREAIKHQCLAVIPRTCKDSELDKIYKGYGLVDIRSLDSNIVIDLRYASNNNFLGKNMYGDIQHAYLQKEVAQKLVKASALLRQQKSELRIAVLDAARPLSIQQMMWTDVNLPNGNKEKFVSSPQIGSLHNYGAAVDVTLCNSQKENLDFGTSFDSFSDTAYTVNEEFLLKSGKLTQQEYDNRKLLRKVMTASGFSPIETEWWHFNSCSRNYAKAHYPLIVSHIFADNPLLEGKAKEQPQLAEVKGNVVSFRIQLLTSVNKYSSSDARFKGLKTQHYQQDNLYKYTTGNYASLEKALTDLENIKAKGFNDAFIVAFNHNQRISIKDAVELMHNQ